MAKHKVSCSIDADLYDRLAEFAAGKHVSLGCVLRTALADYAEYALPDPPVADAKFEALWAEAEAQLSASDLPELNLGKNAIN